MAITFQPAQADIVVVVSSESALVSVNAEELKRFFSGLTRSISGQLMRPVLQKNRETHEEFLRKYIEKSDAQYENLWKKLVFTGKADLPKKVDGEQELYDALAADKGLLGYADSENLPETLKIVAVKKIQHQDSY